MHGSEGRPEDKASTAPTFPSNTDPSRQTQPSPLLFKLLFFHQSPPRCCLEQRILTELGRSPVSRFQRLARTDVTETGNQKSHPGHGSPALSRTLSAAGTLTQTETDESSRLCSCWGLTGGKSRLGCPRGRRCNLSAAWSVCITPPCTELSSHGHLPLEARGSAIKPCVRGSFLSCPATRQHSRTALQINQLQLSVTSLS